MKKVVVGLGNPGSRYERTRHNIGWMVLDRLAERTGSTGRAKARDGAAAVRGRLGDDELILVKPTTYMNLSGQAVRKVLARERAPLGDLLIVVDDMALPFGRLRMRAKGSAGGHNGLRSIIGELGTEGFARLRLGIGAPAKGAVEHVLGDFATAEQRDLERILDAAADAVELWATEGPEAVATHWNGRLLLDADDGAEQTRDRTSAATKDAARRADGREREAGDGAREPGDAAERGHRSAPDAEGVVRTRRGWRRLLPHLLGGDRDDRA